ncbi:pentapeptide repeat-containing protein [Streptomyces sp. NPDC059209]|uniref:pentapeptide repeat-containing protein n=1 Tax=Streptomyces sp. NPDC059209 TaxID=3346769 RepID=UPI003694A064
MSPAPARRPRLRRTTRLAARTSAGPGGNSAPPPETPPAPEGRPEVLDWARRIELVTVVVASVVAVVGLWYSSIQAQDDRALAKEGQITDRYTAAVVNLGSEKMDVRLGGIYALQRIMQDSVRDHPTIANVLATYIRTHAAKPPAKGQDVPADVNAAFDVLTARDTTHDAGFRPDLRAAKLPDVKRGPLAQAALRGADLRDTDLSNAGLVRADLRRTFLDKAYLKGAILFGADLSHALLNRVDLSDANLSMANLTSTGLGGAKLSGADLSRSENLTREQVDSARVDRETQLPASLS